MNAEYELRRAYIALLAARHKQAHKGEIVDLGTFAKCPICTDGRDAFDANLASLSVDRFEIEMLLEAGGIALMLRDEALESGNLSLVSALEPLRHAVESFRAPKP